MMKRLSLALGGAALLVASATAQVGPDVAVSNIGGDVSNYGVSGGIRAYSFRTTSCNVGNERIDWLDDFNMPVIAQNMYRIVDGHIEQLGYSFLKDSFCAVNEFTCGACQGTNCDTLGIGCADTYGSGLNDGINGWAKWGIEANRGEWFSIPPGPTTDNNTIRGRLQVMDAALGDPNSAYLIESQYVSGHDQQDGLGQNNQSWRYVVGGGNLSNIGGIKMFEPAIMAWEDTHPDVMTVEANVINEGGIGQFGGIHGFMWVASKATDLGGGMWRYDYAVQNQTSDRGVGGIDVNLACSGANVSNLVHRGVRHHSGSPYSNAAWTSSVSNATVGWATETVAQNANASAIRWGELHSFSFVADASPTSTGSVTLSLFQGGAGTLTVDAIVPSGGGFTYPGFCTANNNSTGSPASILATGSPLVADNDLDFTVTSIPTHNFGYFLMSQTQQFVATPPGSAGNLCLGGSIVRFSGDVLNSGIFGFVQFQPDANNLPNGTVWQGGQTWNFQYWTRDDQNPSNFSDLATITFCQ